MKVLFSIVSPIILSDLELRDFDRFQLTSLEEKRDI